MTFKYTQTRNNEVTQFDEEWIILNTDNYTITKLNELGGICWSLLQHEQTFDTLIQEINSKYGRNVDSSDIKKFLNELVEYGLVQYAV